MMLHVVVLFFSALALFAFADENSVSYRQPWSGNVTNEERRRLTVSYWQQLQDHVTQQRLQHVIGNNTNYRKKQPYPHLYYDGLFPEAVVRAAAEEIPDNPTLENGCAKNGDKCFKGKDQKGKNAFENDYFHGPATATLFAFMKSSTFVRFLEQLTGIQDIIPDPHYRGSGIHQTLPGGFLGVHADFNRYQQYDMHRRVNSFIYLNPDWEDSFGGHLELWSRDMKKCMGRIRPDLGRFVVFSTTDFSYHGHPKPLTAPAGRSRRSLALYYYTRTRPANECVNNNCNSAHTTLFQKLGCADCALEKCQKFT